MDLYPTASDQRPEVKRRRRKWWRAVIVVGVVGFVFIVYCSGLQFPMMNPSASLAKRLAADFQIRLPAQFSVERGQWVATRDPAEFYLMNVPPDLAESLFSSLEAAGRTNGWEVSREPWRFQPAGELPNWIDMNDDVTLQYLTLGRSMHCYRLAFSPKTGRIFLIWFAT